MKQIRFTRRELYDLVWSEPLSRLCKRYNVSDNAIRKHCKKKDIPLPPQGHWQRVKAGRTMTRVKLSNKLFRYDELIQIQPVFDKPPSLSQRNYFLKAIEEDKRLPLRVSEKLYKPDVSIQQAKESFTKHLQHKGIYYSTKGVSISVSKELMPRALCFADAFVKLLCTRGHVMQEEDGRICFSIYGETVRFEVREKLVFEQRDLHYRCYYPSGDLMLRARVDFIEREWKDGVELLEQKLAVILNYLELRVAKSKISNLNWRIKQVIQDAKKRAEQRLKEREEEEYGYFLRLLYEAHAYDLCVKMRRYITEVEAQRGDKEWIKWAKEKAEWFDPTVRKEDELLDDHHRLKVFEIEEQEEVVYHYHEYRPTRPSYFECLNAPWKHWQ